MTNDNGARRWTGGRIIAVVVGSALLLISLAPIATGTALAALGTRRDNGYLMAETVALTSSGHAIATESVSIESTAAFDVPGRLLGDAKLVVTSTIEKPVFVGVASTGDVRAYLDRVGHSTLARINGDSPDYDTVPGGPPRTPPGEMDFWAASATGTGTQTLTWEVESGDWTVVVMNADGSAPVAADTTGGATVPALGTVVVALLVSGGILLLISLAIIVITLLAAGRAVRE